MTIDGTYCAGTQGGGGYGKTGENLGGNRRVENANLGSQCDEFISAIERSGDCKCDGTCGDGTECTV